MAAIQVQGLRSLNGEIKVQGSKNAVLPMMAAAVLHRGTTVLTNVPDIQDVSCMKSILECLGCSCNFQEHEMVIDARFLKSARIPDRYVKGMRSSIMLLGALLGRMGEALTDYPGGCSIGKRPIDLHLYALRRLGAEIEEKEGEIRARASCLRGAEVDLRYPSVGATENALLASVLASGVTVIRGCAREPEIQELCLFLNNAGAEIAGIGTDCLTVNGRPGLHDSAWRVMGDRIVAGTYLAAAAAATGDVALRGVRPGHMDTVLNQFQSMGSRIDAEDRLVRIRSAGRPLGGRLKTGPYPAFPTDLQSPMLAVMAVGGGEGRIEETVFEGRYETARELEKLGARIRVEGSEARVWGTFPLTGADVEATDLRGGAALVVAGLAARGSTRIGQCRHILRGYEDICRDLTRVGALALYVD